jgi:hypothetical protein
VTLPIKIEPKVMNNKILFKKKIMDPVYILKAYTKI